MMEGVLEQKMTGANTVQEYEDTGQKYKSPLPEAWHGRARPQSPLLLLFFKPKLPCCSFTVFPF